jgi:hypothetical protein
MRKHAQQVVKKHGNSGKSLGCGYFFLLLPAFAAGFAFLRGGGAAAGITLVTAWCTDWAGSKSVHSLTAISTTKAKERSRTITPMKTPTGSPEKLPKNLPESD